MRDSVTGSQTLQEPDRAPSTGERTATIAGAVILALAIHGVTDGRWTGVLLVFAVTMSVLALLPAGVAWLAKPIGAYAGTWIVFNFLRAYADSMPWADAVLDLAPRLERWLAAGTLPSAVLQDRFYEPGSQGWHDYALTAVYVSFFVMPHLIAIFLLWHNRRLFWQYTVGMAILFGLALACFYAIPTSPPWLIADLIPGAGFSSVDRVTEPVLAQLDLPFQIFGEGSREGTHGTVRTSEVRLEPNPIAAMPSIHLAATAMIVGPARRAGSAALATAIVYVLLMGIALVYLGEHYVVDLFAGAAMTTAGWMLAGRWINRVGREDRGMVETAKDPVSR